MAKVKNILTEKERKQIAEYLKEDIEKQIDVIYEIRKPKIDRDFLLKKHAFFLTCMYANRNADKLYRKVTSMLKVKYEKPDEYPCSYCGKKWVKQKGFHKKDRVVILLKGGNYKHYLFCSKKCFDNWENKKKKKK